MNETSVPASVGRLRYDYLLHATVRVEEDWGLPYSDAEDITGDYDSLVRICSEYQYVSSNDVERLLAYKRANYTLAHMEAATHATTCHSLPFVVQASRDEHCNLSCVYCRPTPGVPCVTMPLNRWRQALSVVLPPAREFLPFCWGEPLLAPDFEVTCTEAQQYHTYVSLITNLQHLTDTLSRLFVRHVTRALVSVDTADPLEFARLRRGGDFTVLERNIERLRRSSDEMGTPMPWMGVSAVILRSTLPQLPNLVRWAGETGLRGVYAGRLVIAERIRDFGLGETVDLASSEYEDVYLECLEECRKYKIPLNMYAPSRFIGQGRMCLCPWHHIYVSASGDVSFCNFSRLRIVGRIPLSHDYWNDPVISARRSQWTASLRCDECQSTDYDGRPGVSQFRGY